MNSNVFKKFNRNFYNRTGGFIPSKPLNQNMYPGDFFQIRNGEIIVLGNIYRNAIVALDDIAFEYGIKLNPANWSFSEGVNKRYSGKDTGNNPIEGQFDYNKQILTFDGVGCFFFSGNHPEAVKIANWSCIKDQLIIKLTQALYSFRELYVVTESTVLSDWTLAIAGSEKGELEIVTETESFGLLDIFNDASAKTIRALEIEFYHKETKKKPSFFKAKKLTVVQEKTDVFISELITDRSKIASWVEAFYDFDFYSEDMFHSAPVTINAQASILDMLQANQLNPNTALQYFTWTDANLDDIEKLTISYGY